jgi:hypothetical protein
VSVAQRKSGSSEAFNLKSLKKNFVKRENIKSFIGALIYTGVIYIFARGPQITSL